MNEALGFTYNNDFNPTSFSYAGTSENYKYDNDGLLTSTGDFSITRNSDNGLPEMVTDSTFTLSRTFTGYDEVKTVGVDLSGTKAFGYNLTRNDNGRITTKVETYPIQKPWKRVRVARLLAQIFLRVPMRVEKNYTKLSAQVFIAGIR